MKKRSLDEQEHEAAVNVLQAFPRATLANLLKNGQLPIADVFFFCHLTYETHRICVDFNVWKDMYRKQFPNPDYRLRSNQISRDMRFEKNGISIDIQFKSDVIRIINVINGNKETRTRIRNEVSDIISSICGRPDDNSTVWTRDLGKYRKLFYKMIVYKMLKDGWTITTANGAVCSVCTRGSLQKCNQCQMPLCGLVCFDNHQCSK